VGVLVQIEAMKGGRRYRHKKQKMDPAAKGLSGDLRPKAAILKQRQKKQSLEQRRKGTKKNQPKAGGKKTLPPQHKKFHQQKTGKKKFSKRL
jgi:hypothetical protein